MSRHFQQTWSLVRQEYSKARELAFNLLWPSDAIWWHRFCSILAQVMACCLVAPSHYLNQCWVVISGVLWYSPEGNFRGNAQDNYSWYEFPNYKLKITAAPPKVQGVNSLGPSDAIWRQRSGSTLARVMACCLTAPSHYLNQCWLVISVVLWHSPEGNFRGNAQDIHSWYEFKKILP